MWWLLYLVSAGVGLALVVGEYLLVRPHRRGSLWVRGEKATKPARQAASLLRRAYLVQVIATIVAGMLVLGAGSGVGLAADARNTGQESGFSVSLIIELIVTVLAYRRHAKSPGTTGPGSSRQAADTPGTTP
jgi:hypothetical protein